MSGYVCVYVSMSVYVHVCVGALQARRAGWIPELPDVIVGIWALVLFVEQPLLLTTELSLSRLHKITS